MKLSKYVLSAVAISQIIAPSLFAQGLVEEDDSVLGEEEVTIKADLLVEGNSTTTSAALEVIGDAVITGDLVVGPVADGTPAIAGTIRYNSTTSDFEGYDGSAWKSLTFNFAPGTVVDGAIFEATGNTETGDTNAIFGEDNTITGNFSTAWGVGNTISDYGSAVTSWGAYNTASGQLSTVWGNGNTVEGFAGTAWGAFNTASGVFSLSTAWGWGNTASGPQATAWGYGNISSGGNTTAWGTGTEAGGNNTTAFGGATLATGNCATAWGYGSEATGMTSTAWGVEAIAAAARSTAFGAYNLGYYTFSDDGDDSNDGDTVWFELDPILEIGNGGYDDTQGAYVRSNALTLLKNGQLILTNKFWDGANASDVPADPDSAVADDQSSEGRALVVEGHSQMKGNLTVEGLVTLSQAQGDISMGAFGTN